MQRGGRTLSHEVRVDVDAGRGSWVCEKDESSAAARRCEAESFGRTVVHDDLQGEEVESALLVGGSSKERTHRDRARLGDVDEELLERRLAERAGEVACDGESVVSVALSRRGRAGRTRGDDHGVIGAPLGRLLGELDRLPRRARARADNERDVDERRVGVEGLARSRHDGVALGVRQVDGCGPRGGRGKVSLRARSRRQTGRATHLRPWSRVRRDRLRARRSRDQLAVPEETRRVG